METTLIQVSIEVKDYLLNNGKKGETYDTVLKRLLKIKQMMEAKR